MSNEYARFPLALHQQDYYFVSIKNNPGYSLSDYWQAIGPTTEFPSFAYSNTVIEHRQFHTDIPYFRGIAPEGISEDNSGNPPFRYDLLALSTTIGSQSIIILAFPFAGLAKYLLRLITSQQQFKSNCDFFRVVVPSLIKHHVPSYEPEKTTKIVSLSASFSVKNNTLTSIRLAGDAPLDSDVYKSFLQNRISKDEVLPKTCTLFFEIPYPIQSEDASIITYPRLRSRIHIDSNGNFRFYVHIGGTNFCIIPSVIDYLNDLDTLELTSTNPVLRLEVKEEQ